MKQAIKARIFKLFDDIGNKSVNQTEVSFYCLVYSAPFPLIWVLVLFAMKQSPAMQSMNLNVVGFYYQIAPVLSCAYLILALWGWLLLKQEKKSHIFEHCAVQTVAIMTFIMSAFFGFFTTPVSLALIAAIGIGSFVFDKAKIWGGLFTISLLCLLTAFLHLNGLPAIPITQSFSSIEGPLLPWVSFMFLATSTFFIAIFAIFTAYLMEQSREKGILLEGLSGKLARYLSPQVYDSIFKGEKNVQIETYRKKLTVFFSDIKSFTEITDGMESEALTTLLNAYLNEMSVIALKHGGTIDKFIGDAIMIFFGDPESRGEEEDALACISMALEMRERMKELQSTWYRQGIAEPLEIRIGINTGFCTVGNFGSRDRLDYTVVGSEVNEASKLESKAEPNTILISESSYQLVKDKIICHVKNDTEGEKSYEVKHFLDSNNSHNEMDIESATHSFLQEIGFAKMDENEKAYILNSVQKLL